MKPIKMNSYTIKIFKVKDLKCNSTVFTRFNRVLKILINDTTEIF
jgi:hypothetical protein